MSVTLYLTTGSSDVGLFNIYSGSIIDSNALLEASVTKDRLVAGWCTEVETDIYTIQSSTTTCQSIAYANVALFRCDLEIQAIGTAPTPIPIPVPVPSPTGPTPNPVPTAPQPVPTAPVAPQPVPAPTVSPQPQPVAPVPQPVAPQPVPVAPQPVPQPVPAPVAPIPIPVPAATCRIFDVTNDGCGGTPGDDQVTYTLCRGGSRTSTIPCGDSIEICAVVGSINEGGDLTVTGGFTSCT